MQTVHSGVIGIEQRAGEAQLSHDSGSGPHFVSGSFYSYMCTE